MNRKPRSRATCHPEQWVLAKTLCKTCYHREWGKSQPKKPRKPPHNRWEGYVRPPCRNHPERKARTRGLCNACACREKYARIPKPAPWNPETGRRWKKLGVTREMYEQMFIAQGGCCAICRGAAIEERLCVDHDHSTRAVRGLLCRVCNLMVGYAADDPRILNAAIEYLNRFASVDMGSNVLEFSK